MTAKKELNIITLLIICSFIVGVTPWLLRLCEATRNSVKWMERIGFQYWGWFLVFCLAGYTFLKILRSKSISNITKVIVVVISLSILGWSLLWAFLLALGLAVSTIV